MGRLEDLEARMVSADEVVSYFRGTLYGESGVGKTVLAMEIAQAITPEGMGIAFLDARDGFSVLNNHPHLKKRTLRLPVDDLHDLTTVANGIRQGEGTFGFIGTVVVDELSALSQDNLERIVRARYNVPDNEIATNTPDWDDYRPNQAQTITAAKALESLPDTNIIFVSHVRYDKDNRGVERVSPNFSPGISKALRENSHLIGFVSAALTRNAERDNSADYERDVQVHPSKLVVAKSRVGGLPVKVDPDTLVDSIVSWLGNPEAMSTDLASDQNVPLAEDEAPTDGYVASAATEDDDAPAYSSAE